MMQQQVKLSVNELTKIYDWLKENDIKNNTIVTIKNIVDNGIGVVTEASVGTTENAGIWIDVTDYDNW